MYLTVIIDLYNRKIVAWSISENLSTAQTIIPAWNMAMKSNKISEGLIFHSDRGSQYASQSFPNIIKSYKGIITKSMSRKGNC